MKNKLTATVLSILLLLCSCAIVPEIRTDVPAFETGSYTILDANMPTFSFEEFDIASYEEYGELDYLGRCTYAEAVIGVDIMPTEERGAIGSVKPSGWQTVKYDFVDGKYL